MKNEQPKWKSINMGEILPCQSFLRKKDGEILKLSTTGGVKVGQDCYYLPVDEVINVIKNYPAEENEDEKIRKEIVDFVNKEYRHTIGLDEKNRWIAWLEKKSERKHQYKSRPRYVGEGKLLGKKESTAFGGDESIRKALIEMVHDTVGDSLWIDYNVHKEYAISWLEKQGEHANFRNNIQVGDKVTRNEDGVLVNLSQLNRVAKKQGEQKPTEVEPKFKVEDWIIDVQGVSANQIIGYEDDSYHIKTSCSKFYLPMKLTEKNYRLWTIQDAKDGDVLYSPCCKLLWIYKDDNSCYVGNNLSYNKNCVVVNSSICIPSDVCPATKEQRGLLFQKMHEAGYEWDAEKKELKKIEQQPILDVEIPFGAKDSELKEVTYDIPKGYHAEIEDNKVVIKKGEQKPAEWSEEIEAAISLLKDIAEEQEKDYCPHNANDLRKAAIYLETCRSQSTLKPSDKHYELEEFARVVRGNLTGISKTVQKLFEAKYLQLTGRKMYIGFKD